MFKLKQHHLLTGFRTIWARASQAGGSAVKSETKQLTWGPVSNCQSDVLSAFVKKKSCQYHASKKVVSAISGIRRQFGIFRRKIIWELHCSEKGGYTKEIHDIFLENCATSRSFNLLPSLCSSCFITHGSEAPGGKTSKGPPWSLNQNKRISLIGSPMSNSTVKNEKRLINT